MGGKIQQTTKKRGGDFAAHSHVDAQSSHDLSQPAVASRGLYGIPERTSSDAPPPLPSSARPGPLPSTFSATLSVVCFLSAVIVFNGTPTRRLAGLTGALDNCFTVG